MPWYLGATLAVAVLSVLLQVRVCFVAVTYVDGVVLRAVARLRFDALTTVLRTMDHIIWPWTISVVALGTIAVLLVYRRFRYLAVYAALVFAGLLGSLLLSAWIGRMRPTEVRILTRWEGYAYPSRPVLGLALVCAGVLYTLVPSSLRRTRAKLIAAGVIGAYGFARVYLAVDHPTDVLAAIVLGWVVAVVTFRLVTPEEAFPISYRRGTRAHLDLNDRRRTRNHECAGRTAGPRRHRHRTLRSRRLRGLDATSSHRAFRYRNDDVVRQALCTQPSAI